MEDSFSSATSRKPSLLSPSAGPEWRKLTPVIGVPRWEEKIPLAKTTLEKTWLFHEIGRCYLELGQAWEAQSYGEKSQQCAEEEGDMEWQLNASVLVAQAQGIQVPFPALRPCCHAGAELSIPMDQTNSDSESGGKAPHFDQCVVPTLSYAQLGLGRS